MGRTLLVRWQVTLHVATMPPWLDGTQCSAAITGHIPWLGHVNVHGDVCLWTRGICYQFSSSDRAMFTFLVRSEKLLFFKPGETESLEPQKIISINLSQNIPFLSFKERHFFLKNIYLFLKRREGKERGRETSMCGCLLSAPYWGPNLARNPGMIFIIIT